MRWIFICGLSYMLYLCHTNVIKRLYPVHMLSCSSFCVYGIEPTVVYTWHLVADVKIPFFNAFKLNFRKCSQLVTLKFYHLLFCQVRTCVSVMFDMGSSGWHHVDLTAAIPSWRSHGFVYTRPTTTSHHCCRPDTLSQQEGNLYEKIFDRLLSFQYTFLANK